MPTITPKRIKTVVQVNLYQLNLQFVYICIYRYAVVTNGFIWNPKMNRSSTCHKGLGVFIPGDSRGNDFI